LYGSTTSKYDGQGIGLYVIGGNQPEGMNLEVQEISFQHDKRPNSILQELKPAIIKPKTKDGIGM
jgi:hypothetical protein